MKILTLLLLITQITVHTSAQDNEVIIFQRLENLYQAKKHIIEKSWPSANDTIFDIPLIYYTETACYIANPAQDFIQKFKAELRFQNKELKIYKTPSRLDSIPFHMETLVIDQPGEYFSYYPYGRATSLEGVRKFAPGLAVEIWSGMVLHELFHGYQFRHEPYLKHIFKTKVAYSVINDSLQSNYKIYDWFKQNIDEENSLILKAIEEKSKKNIDSLIRRMFTIRQSRRERILKTIDRYIDFYEKSFETMEGTARYIEVEVSRNFHKAPISDKLKQLDTNYNNIKNTNPGPDAEWNYKTEVSQKYTYAIGYNMARLLDKLGIEYKTRLFREPELTLEDILRKAVE